MSAFFSTRAKDGCADPAALVPIVRVPAAVLSAVILLAAFISEPVAAQSADDSGAFEPFGTAVAGDGSGDSSGTGDSFGFGFGDDAGSTGFAPSQTLDIGGELKFSAVQFIGTLADSLDGSGSVSDGLADSASSSGSLANSAGKLRFDASGKDVDASLRLAVSPSILSSDPSRVIDEAWVRLWLGDGMLEGGLMKVTWGKADALSVLDVLNPQDLSDLTITELKDQKIARPMLHTSFPVGSAAFEAAWLPVYKSNLIAWDGPWTPKQITELKEMGYSMLYDQLYQSYTASAWATAYAAALEEYFNVIGVAPGIDTLDDATAAAIDAADSTVAGMSAQLSSQAAADANDKLADLIEYPAGDTLDWSQFGARITGTIGHVDVGLQYFWGFLPNPVIDVAAAMANQSFPVMVDYNRYHQIGADLAAVIFGLNARFEAGANLTDDFDGDDPLTYNPALVWAAGFDRDLVAGINLNAQAKGSYVLAYDRIDDSVGSSDVEAAANLTDTMVAVRLARSFNRETVECELAGVWCPENEDFAVAPSVTFAIGEAELKMAGRWFAGNENGNLGQYADNSYAEVSLKYMF